MSEQNLIDCCNDYGNAGCNGGTIENAYECLLGNGGINNEYDYKYEEKVRKPFW